MTLARSAKPARLPRSLWRNRDFLLLRVGQAVSVAGSGVSGLAFPLLALTITHSTIAAGLVGFFGSAPRLLFTLPGGVLVDRWDRRRTMMLCDTGRALALGSVALTLCVGVLPVVQLDIVAFVEGSLSVVFGLAESAAIPRVVPPDQLTEAASINQATDQIGSLVGPPLGGLLYGLAHLLPFAVDAVSYVLSVLSLQFVVTPLQEVRQRSNQRVLSEVGEGVRWAWHHPFLRVSVFLLGGINFLAAAQSLAVIVLVRHLGATPPQIGLVFTIYSLGGLLGSLVAGRVGRHVRLGMVLICVQWGFALLFPLYTLAPNYIIVGIIGAAMVAMGICWNVLAIGYLAGLIPDALQGRVRGAMQLVPGSLLSLGPLFAGVMLQVAGLHATFLVFGALAAILALIASFSRAVRQAA